MPKSAVISFLGASLFLSCSAATVYGQEDVQRAALVNYTEAIEQPVEQTVQLPGYVEAPNVSILASEIGGLVTELKVREGDRVATGQALVMLRTTPLELKLLAAQARLKEAQAWEKLAEKNLERFRGLAESKTISFQQLDESQYEFDAWQGRIETLRAEIASIQFDIERSTIRAPFNGVVVSRYTEVGQWSKVGDSVLEVLSTDIQEVHVDVPEKYFNDLKVGVEVSITFDSHPGQTYPAHIRALIPRVDTSAHTFTVELRLSNSSENISAGMLARVTFPLGQSTVGTLVPKDAIVRQGRITVVYLVKGGSAIPAPVTPGAAMGLWTVVDGDVSPGDKVITRGNERLQPGQPVQGELIAYPSP